MNGYSSPEKVLMERGAVMELYSPGVQSDSVRLKPLETFNAASLAAIPTPDREFLDSERMFPCRNVTMFSGDGGTGKSLLAMQLAAAVCVGAPWLGMTVQQGKALYVSAEDDASETHIRLKEISAAEKIDLSIMTGLEIAVLAGRDAVLAFETNGTKMTLTPLFERLRQRMVRLRPKLLILDNLADIFAGNENVRPLARQFVSSLRSLAIEFDCVVLLLAHPSLSGIATGSGTSGNTAWNNSVRSRIFLIRTSGDLDPNGRTLQTMKANYSAAGGSISLRWEAGRFVNIDEPSSSAGSCSTLAMQAERIFVQLVRWHAEKGINISPSRSSCYAPTIFARHPQSEGVSKRRFEQAMAVLLEQDRIAVNHFGPPSKRRQTIVISTRKAPDQ